eukprot:2321864-Pyramimonas_sp.AAC.1
MRKCSQCSAPHPAGTASHRAIRLPTANGSGRRGSYALWSAAVGPWRSLEVPGGPWRSLEVPG